VATVNGIKLKLKQVGNKVGKYTIRYVSRLASLSHALAQLSRRLFGREVLAPASGRLQPRFALQ
jgi:hypothetical protein